jgi:hypothetical protein
MQHQVSRRGWPSKVELDYLRSIGATGAPEVGDPPATGRVDAKVTDWANPEEVCTYKFARGGQLQQVASVVADPLDQELIRLTRGDSNEVKPEGGLGVDDLHFSRRGNPHQAEVV